MILNFEWTQQTDIVFSTEFRSTGAGRPPRVTAVSGAFVSQIAKAWSVTHGVIVPLLWHPARDHLQSLRLIITDNEPTSSGTRSAQKNCQVLATEWSHQFQSMFGFSRLFKVGDCLLRVNGWSLNWYSFNLLQRSARAMLKSGWAWKKPYYRTIYDMIL